MINFALEKIIDNTLLKPYIDKETIVKFCNSSMEYEFISIAILPNMVRFAAEMLKESAVKVSAAISFPTGMTPIELKMLEVKEAIRDGADELDMVLNMRSIKSHDYDNVKKEMREFRKHTSELTSKVILETSLLTDKEIINLCKFASDVGIDFVKTSTGFNGNNATLHAVKLMKRSINGKTKVKAAGGIESLKDVLELLEAGAERIGTSRGLEIIEDYRGKNIKTG